MMHWSGELWNPTAQNSTTQTNSIKQRQHGNPAAYGGSPAAPGCPSAPARKSRRPATPPTNNDNSSSPKQHFERREDYQRVSAHIGNKHALQWPSTEDRASLMERISVSTLRAGMVLPLLQIGDGSRDICCDISGTGQSHTPIDNSIKEPDMRTSTPTVLKACSAPNSVVMADAAICARGNTWDQHVCNLASTQCPLTAPDTPLAHRLLALAWEPLNNIGPETPKQARADGAFQPPISVVYPFLKKLP